MESILQIVNFFFFSLLLTASNGFSFIPTRTVPNAAFKVIESNRISKFSCHATANEHVSEGWKAGNFQQDFRVLKMAVAKSKALTSFDEVERTNILETVAKGKRALYPDLMKFVAFIATALFYVRISFFCQQCDSYKGILKILKVHTAVMNAVFHVFIVQIPCILLLDNKLNNQQTCRPKSEFELDFVNADEDCSNFSLCLLESWVSVVWPSFFLSWMSLFFQWISPGDYVTTNFALGLMISQFVSRIGAATSIHQFPMLLYKLRRSMAYGPMERFPTFVKYLVDILMSTLSIGIVTDVASIADMISNQSAVSTMRQDLSSRISLRYIAFISLLVVSYISNLVHFIAFKKLIRIGVFSNISLSSAFTELNADVDHSVKLR